MDKIFKLIDKEKKRQIEDLEMIPSENYVSSDVLKALGSVLTNKYSEGFPHARYYAGNSVIDEIEDLTCSLANEVFKTKHAIVQPYSGSPANMAVYLALIDVGDTIMGLKLPSGGHLTHGAPASYTGKLFNAVQYEVEENGRLDMDKIEKLAQEHKPKIIWVGATAYPFIFDFTRFGQIADGVGAWLVADISHIAGLVAGGAHPSPVEDVHIITTTTHKTLRGPRGAMILVTEKGLKKDPELSEKLEKSVFPGLQGGPHDNTTAAIAVALEEAKSPEFKQYIEQVIKNNKVLATELSVKTENHLILWDLSQYGFGLGYQAHIALEMAGIIVNKNTVPGEKASAFYPSGIRLGTPALTSRGMKEEDMRKIASWIKLVIEEIKGFDLPVKQEDRKDFIKNFRAQMKENKVLAKIKKEVLEFTKNFPVPGIN